MASILAESIEALSREKNIDPKIIVSAIEDAVVTASRKQSRSKENLHAVYNKETGEVELYAVKRVVSQVTNPDLEISLEEALQVVGEDVEIGDELQFPRQLSLGRIAAQTARQIIFQKVREAERNNIYEEYVDKKGELVNGFVKRFERGNIIVDIGKIETVLPRSQQSPVEHFSQGERIRVVIHEVTKESKGLQVEVSRSSPELLKKLFEMEVPEIYDGTVVIKAAVREPGDRAKIAVMSNEPDVDPVGACVGMKGSRVQAIIRELRGEKIDIIQWSSDPVVFAANALSPAKVSRVQVTDFHNKKLEVIVEDSQLSLAIGKRGQNVRLAAKLVGWHIDIRSEAEMKREVASQIEALMSSSSVPITAVEGIDQFRASLLKAAGINTVEELAGKSADEIATILDVSLDEANSLIGFAREIQEVRREKQATSLDSTSET
ncbi:MAG: transcription termination factor NusA [Acidobacteriota bacterium]|nr:transcription termination factor NusA [Blastocatellia bacterium]MDW8413562.1 transcription termination factor NusA [Acidobacteriota bacterium]